MEEAIAQQFAEITRVEVVDEEISQFKREHQFVGKCVNLLIEAGSFITVATHIFPSGRDGWTRDEAVIGGHLVRLYKLISVILDQTCQDRRETAFIASRLHFETIVNLFFLTEHSGKEVFDDFVLYSLQHELRLLAKIRTSIQERGGETIPIEDRMLRSIERTFERAGVSEDDATNWKKGAWARLNLFQRAQKVGLDEAYLAIFGGGSLIVHGNWSDFDQHHLRFEDGRFHPDINFRHVRPQSLEANCLTSIDAVRRIFEFYGLLNLRAMVVHLCEDYLDRLRRLSEAHEAFLQRA